MTERIPQFGLRRGVRIAACAALLTTLTLVAAQPAQAVPREIDGGNTRLEVNVATFVTMLSDGIFATAIPPATLEFGANPAAIFPVAPPGAADAEQSLSLVTHAGGLRLEKQSVGVTLETTNYIVQCTSLTSCRLLATANQAIPNEVAEIANPQFTDNEEGTVTITGIAQLSAATALVLNTLFQTDIFHEGFQLGTVRSTFTYDVTEPGGYVRPRGATPMHVSLVPAYQECMVPTSQHGAPLSEPSCTPPLQNSPHLTVGTPDSNGAGAKSVADVLYKVQMGNDQTPEDEADVLIDVSATDIRNRTGLTDYTGELQAVFDLRITDGANSLLPPLFPANESGTMQDTSFSVTVPCAATDDATVGSTCAISTSADAVVPGVALEGMRSVWEMGAVNVFDGGPDGDAETAGNARFATQGVFVP